MDMEELKKVLIIINTIDAGGAETFVMKVFRELSQRNYQFDFLINKKDSSFYRKEIESLGGKIYLGYSKSKHPIKCFMTIYKTVKREKYQRVFCVAVHPVGALDVIAAKTAGAKNILVRSTNSNAGGWISSALAGIFRPLMRCYATRMIAPSKEAARWLFGEKAVRKKRVEIVHNAIDLSRFQFNAALRTETRKMLGIKHEQYVIGHVGRFNRQKNHLFLIDSFIEFKKMEPEALLLLVGEGELKHTIENRAVEAGVAEAVRFLGVRNDIPELLMSMDVMLFPSLYEGLPNVIVEAQATGLPCLISDSITKEVILSEWVENDSLKNSPMNWAKHAKKQLKKNEFNKRENATGTLNESGYSITKTAEQMNKFLR